MAKTIRRRSAARYYIPPEPAGVMTRPLRMAAFVAGAGGSIVATLHASSAAATGDTAPTVSRYIIISQRTFPFVAHQE